MSNNVISNIESHLGNMATDIQTNLGATSIGLPTQRWQPTLAIRKYSVLTAKAKNGIK